MLQCVLKCVRNWWCFKIYKSILFLNNYFMVGSQCITDVFIFVSHCASKTVGHQLQLGLINGSINELPPIDWSSIVMMDHSLVETKNRESTGNQLEHEVDFPLKTRVVLWKVIIGSQWLNMGNHTAGQTMWFINLMISQECFETSMNQRISIHQWWTPMTSPMTNGFTNDFTD